ncbi:hypothetical protein QQZ08_010984 [Neonectria magnoliae]|uniref:Uncharacterized protein n=1 Tax=Neonectria magnoliae TaxID=2732573 RepID=A0ABR1HDI3_9HYPO
MLYFDFSGWRDCRGLPVPFIANSSSDVQSIPQRPPTSIWFGMKHADLRITHDTGLLPDDIDFEAWTAFMADFKCHINVHSLHQADPHYGYGELRLSRLNTLYRFSVAGFSLRDVVHGFMPWPTRYTNFFEQNFG